MRTHATQSVEMRELQSSIDKLLQGLTASRAAHSGASPEMRDCTLWWVASQVVAHSSSRQKPEFLSTQNLNPPTAHQPQPGLLRQLPQSLR